MMNLLTWIIQRMGMQQILVLLPCDLHLSVFGDYYRPVCLKARSSCSCIKCAAAAASSGKVSDEAINVTGPVCIEYAGIL